MKALRLAVVAALFVSSGAHWALVEGIAKARMAYLQRYDPCALCMIVEDAAAKSTGPALAPPSSARVELYFERASLGFFEPADAPMRLAAPSAAALAANPPPFVKPPRAALA